MTISNSIKIITDKHKIERLVTACSGPKQREYGCKLHTTDRLGKFHLLSCSSLEHFFQ